MEKYFVPNPIGRKKNRGMTDFLRTLDIGDYFYINNDQRYAVANNARKANIAIKTKQDSQGKIKVSRLPNVILMIPRRFRRYL